VAVIGGGQRFREFRKYERFFCRSFVGQQDHDQILVCGACSHVSPTSSIVVVGAHGGSERFLLRLMALIPSSLSLARRERFLFWWRILAISCSSALRAPRSFASTLSSRILRAKKRLSACERSLWHFTRMPVGRWCSTTQVATLLTFCPPAPDDRTKCSSMSCSWTPKACIRSRRNFCFSGETMLRAMAEDLA
jgi:hypothetical protein